MLAESLSLLWIGWSRFGLATPPNALHTFSFLTLLYFAAFSIVSARERRWFRASMPSRALLAAVAADVLTGTVLTLVGLPGLSPLPWWQTLAVFLYAMVVCLGLNDAMKVAMIQWNLRRSSIWPWLRRVSPPLIDAATRSPPTVPRVPSRSRGDDCPRASPPEPHGARRCAPRTRGPFAQRGARRPR